MGKNAHLVNFDPQFKIKGQTQIVHARQSCYSRKGNNCKNKTNRWSQLQQQRYISFVKKNLDKFQNPKKCKVFSLMSKTIKTRSGCQCKTHHVKMILKYKSIERLLKPNKDRQCEFIISSQESRRQRYRRDVRSQMDKQNKPTLMEINTSTKSGQQNISDDQKQLFDVLQF